MNKPWIQRISERLDNLQPVNGSYIQAITELLESLPNGGMTGPYTNVVRLWSGRISQTGTMIPSFSVFSTNQPDDELLAWARESLGVYKTTAMPATSETSFQVFVTPQDNNKVVSYNVAFDSPYTGNIQIVLNVRDLVTGNLVDLGTSASVEIRTY
jgi:hypothetical protein